MKKLSSDSQWLSEIISRYLGFELTADNIIGPVNPDQAYDGPKLLLPAHQNFRGDIWEDKKKIEWIDLIQKTSQDDESNYLSGTIVTYRLEGETNSSPKKLNDGANRVVHSCMWYIKKIIPGVEKTKENENKKKQLIKFVECLRKAKISEEYKIYKDNDEAIDDYIAINSKGTMATPYEILSSHFTKLPNWNTVWADILLKIETSVSKKLVYLGVEQKPNKKNKNKYRETIQKFKRDTRAVFYRFAQGLDSKWSPKVTSKNIENKKDQQIEDKLYELFEQQGPEKIQEILTKFENFLNDYIALYAQIWQEKKLGIFTHQKETAIRWWLNYSVYHYNNKFDIKTLRLFTEAHFDKFKAKTTMWYIDKNGEQSNVNAQLQNIMSITSIYNALGFSSEDIEKKETKRKKTNSLELDQGFNKSHVKSFLNNGNGEVLPENARENQSRGSSDMSDEEIKRLSTIV